MCASGTGDMESSGEEVGRSTAPPASAAAPHLNGSNKIIGRNVNGTMVVTSAPANEAELQLYRVMQRASLLAYYDTLLEMGGDDVQQLCDAGEEEFLEIMALVGMASKPLHVRRLQKALQEWVTNPALFQIPIVPNLCQSENPFMQCNQRLLSMPPSIPNVLPRVTVASPESNRPMYSPSPGAPENSCGSTTSAPNASPVHNQTPPSIPVPKPIISTSPAPIVSNSTSHYTNSRSFSPQMSTCPPASASTSPSSANCSPVQLTPILFDVQVQKLASAAERLSKHLPQLEPKPQNTKKKMCKDLELVMQMPETDPKRMEEIRKYAAIYGRFDCKRKPEKPLTLHEVMVNEAAAQMCRCVPALLTRRDELFPLARQVVRHAGLHYSKHTLPAAQGSPVEEAEEAPPSAKRARQLVYEASVKDGEDCTRTSPDASSRGPTTPSWWGVKTESDDTDSRCSYSSTPPPQESETERERERERDRERVSGVQVVAARGDSIIAVANPALHIPHAQAQIQSHALPHPARNHSN